MTVDAAVGSPDKALDNLVGMLAASETFQAWVGVATGDADAATLAAAHIHVDGVEPADPTKPFTKEETESLLPFAVVFEIESDQREEAVLADSWEGTFVVEFTADAGEGTPYEVNRRLNNVVAGVIDDLLAMRGEAGCLANFRVKRVGGVWREPDASIPTKGDLAHRLIHVFWAGL